ncbi:unnamed protein product [Macrosiphum euphorbiae]|uniref:Transposase domain-containing protein n=1 Tax=Macrosiphum euphorbiae TaxID=13131 RepID=A0AAV0W962_9HEMI|nr:unnamed protein product [Macrosiphum euphorbiae]
MTHNQYLSRSTKRRRFLEEVEVIDLFKENPSSAPPETQPSTHQVNILEEHLDTSSHIIQVSDNNNSNFQVNDLDLEVLDTKPDSYNTSDEETVGTNFFDNDAELILKSLAQWAVNFNITNMAFSALLKNLKSHKCFNSFSVDARTILKCSNTNSTEILSVPPGKYYHFGIANGLKNINNFLNNSEGTIKINIGIDGLPLTKSSGSSFWPILGSIQYFSSTYVFMIGLYWGLEKPMDSNIFLDNMVKELKELSSIGMSTPYGTKIVLVNCISCDAPAKSFVTKTKGHSGFYSCPRCDIEGIYYENRVCFPGIKGNSRTHIDFVNRTNEEYHVTDSISILTDIPHIDIVHSFSLDYMHLVCLGVTKKIILLWLGNLKKSPLHVRLQNKNVQAISSNLLSLRPHICSDFSRYPRGLNDLPRWKATEFRLFLLYSGPVVLKGILNNECYKHFICLHICFRILLTPDISVELVDFSEKLLMYFVDKFGKLYGKHFVSHNVHGLLHIVDDYRKFGFLDSCSCFPFENYMKVLKKMVRKHEKPLEQVIKRYDEILEFCKPELVIKTSSQQIKLMKPHSAGPLMNDRTVSQFRTVTINNIKISISSISDSYIGFEKQGKLNICQVVNIISENDRTANKIEFIVKIFNKVESYFEKPLNSFKLGIAVVDNLSDNCVQIDIHKTKFKKYMILSSNQDLHLIAFPILHTNVI